MASTVKKIIASNYRVVVVVGGGISARQYITAAKALDATPGMCDYLGILVSRLNARVFIEALRDDSLVLSEPPESLQAVRAGLQLKKVVVVGGLQPGQSTTAVAALCAEYCKAERVIYATDVDGVYDSDPRTNKDAKKLDVVSYEKLRELTQTKGNVNPGQYRIMDGVALTILERSALPAVILQGTEAVVLQAVAGTTVGTKVCAGQ
mmetsp:Transcript_26728/g.64981  ORF Transcript_26728/g.64981 Transcript_26728/m.64981 type:complete len:207 (+) Transcript_26728:337-957(+)